MLTRRDVLKRSVEMGVAGRLAAASPVTACTRPNGIEVNDIQSQLNATRVRAIHRPTTLDEIANVVRAARRSGCSVSVAGGRHAMGGQQFGTGALLLDMSGFHRVLRFDEHEGRIEVEAGIEWPELIADLAARQAGRCDAWSIREKQTGVDRVSLGGSLASNVHGRGLTSPPIVGDVESFVLLDADGRLHSCSRTENCELFSLAIGGYGLFGVIVSVTLRLVRRRKVQRVVEIIPVKELLPRVRERIDAGFVYGDCQYATDLEQPADSHPGVFACYRPVAPETPIRPDQRQLTEADWVELYRLARGDKPAAFRRYADYYLSTNGQVYWSDTHQLAGAFDGYRQAVDPRLGTEVITEVYVSADNFAPFMARVRQDCIDHAVDLTYGTIRFIERDAETFLAWAREKSVCIVCNLHVQHTEAGKRKAAEDFRQIIERAIEFGGRYYLTYHRWATRSQVERCYPQFVEFLRLKRKYDRGEVFQSDWYRHYRTMFADRL